MACRVRAHPRPDHRSGRRQRSRHRHRGVTVSAALSTGECFISLVLLGGESKRLTVLQMRLARCNRVFPPPGEDETGDRAPEGPREEDRRKDWVEKTSTDPRAAVRRDQSRGPRRAGDEPLRTRTVEQPGGASLRTAGSNRAISPKRLGASSSHVCSTKLWGRVEQVPGRVHVATMLRMWVRRARKPQEPSGLRVPSLHCWTVQRRRHAARNIAAWTGR